MHCTEKDAHGKRDADRYVLPMRSMHRKQPEIASSGLERYHHYPSTADR